MKVIKRLWCMSILLLCTQAVFASARNEADVLKLLKLLKMVDQIKKSSGGGGPSGAPSGRPISPKPPKSPRPSKRAQSPVQDSALQESIEYQQAVEESRAMAQQSKAIYKDIPSVPTSVKKPKSPVTPSKRPTADSGSAWDDEVKAIERSKQSYAEEQIFEQMLKESRAIAQQPKSPVKPKPKSPVQQKKQPTVTESGSAWDDEAQAVQRSKQSYAEEQAFEQMLKGLQATVQSSKSSKNAKELSVQQSKKPAKTTLLQQQVVNIVPVAPNSRLHDVQCENVNIYSVETLQQNAETVWRSPRFEKQPIIPGVQENWGFVRMQDRANCAYHALKNCIAFMDFLQSQQDAFALQKMQKDLKDVEELIKRLEQWVPHIYNRRVKNIWNTYRLRVERQQLSVSFGEAKELKDLQKLKKLNQQLKSLQAGFDFVTDEGLIETDNLSTEEVQSLLQNFAPQYEDNILVIDNQFCDNPEIYGPIYNRIMQFQERNDDILAIVWTENGLGHFIGFVVVKNAGTISIYDLNSLVGVASRFDQPWGGVVCILNMLCN